jgi:hypothetical protein
LRTGGGYNRIPKLQVARHQLVGKGLVGGSLVRSCIGFTIAAAE